MRKDVAVDAKYMPPFYSMAKAFKMAEVPLLLFAGGDLARFVEQTSALLNATVIYSSQPDFEAQVLASLPRFDYLFVVIDQVLAGEAHLLVRAYLAARDVMGADNSKLANWFGANPPAPEHRMVLLMGRDTFAAYGPAEQHEIQEFSICISVP